MSESYNDRRRAKQRIKPIWKDHFPKFIAALETRMKAGHRTYGDRSFNRPLFNLLTEIEEELLDQGNWAFIGWVQLHSLRERIQKLEHRLEEIEMEEILGRDSC